jgi:hypothetical protein
MDVLVVIAVIAVIWWGVASAAKKNREMRDQQEAAAIRARADELIKAACEFVSQVNAARCYPDVSPGDVSIRKGEFAILKEPATLFEQKSHRTGSAIGTRVKVGKMPVYLGSSHSTSYETTDPIAAGELVITNLRIIFLADTRSATILLKDAVGISAGLDQMVTPPFLEHAKSRG